MDFPTEATQEVHGTRDVLIAEDNRPKVGVMTEHVLEAAAQAFADATSKPPFLYELGAAGARKVLDDVQAGPVTAPDVSEKWVTVACDHGDVRVRIVKPAGVTGPLPVVLYIHGGGWVLGNAGTHDRLVRELAAGAEAAVAFVEYDRSPEAQYPVAIEQAYAAARWIVRDGDAEGLDADRLAVDGVSGAGRAGDRRRERCAARRGRSLRAQTDPGRSAHHERTVQRDHPRFHDAQPGP